MATKLHGYINLSKIPKELITTNRAGDKILWVDVIERRNEGKYGETHSITCYDNRSRETTYLSNLTPQNFGNDQQPQQASIPAPAPELQPRKDDDLPW